MGDLRGSGYDHTLLYTCLEFSNNRNFKALHVGSNAIFILFMIMQRQRSVKQLIYHQRQSERMWSSELRPAPELCIFGNAVYWSLRQVHHVG